jgi:hypothetical protein
MENNVIKIKRILNKIEKLDAAILYYEILKTTYNSKESEIISTQLKEVRKQWIEILDTVRKAH